MPLSPNGVKATPICFAVAHEYLDDFFLPTHSAVSARRKGSSAVFDFNRAMDEARVCSFRKYGLELASPVTKSRCRSNTRIEPDKRRGIHRATMGIAFPFH